MFRERHRKTLLGQAMAVTRYPQLRSVYDVRQVLRGIEARNTKVLLSCLLGVLSVVTIVVACIAALGQI